MFSLGAVAASALWLGLNASAADNAETYRQLNLFGDVFDRVRADYVEVPDEEKLIDSAINGMLAGLDPHSSYMNPKRYQDMQVQTRGEFGGLGIEVTMENGVVKVVSPIDDTPAARAGLLANDLITHLDGEQVMGMNLNEAVDKMRGRVNTKIILTIVRPGKDQPFDVTLTRDVIRIKAVKYDKEGDIGYIRVSSFNEQTQESLDDAMKSLKKDLGTSLKGYIVDLRNNPGGLLDQAISVSDTFLDRGEVVSTRGRNSADTQRFSAQAGDSADGKPVVVLINGGSASASEIVAGALQDHKRAKLIGTRSFGKGSVQTIIPLGSQGAIRLTTARYYTPSGKSIQALGITPDITIEQVVPDDVKATLDRSDRGEASLRGHLKGDSGSEEQAGSSSYVPKEKEKDTQLQAAIDLLHGKEVKSTAAPAGTQTAKDATPAKQEPTTAN
ncbi:MAG: S41 family peptidase [Parvibaculaceae bacterium]